MFIDSVLNFWQVSIPTKPTYIPNQRPPPVIHSSLPNGTAQQRERSRRIVISRFLLVDGNISFSVGTQTDGVVIPDAKEVPVAKILDHISSAELERFENQDFLDEDERERLLPPKKSRGRPRNSDRIVPSFKVAPVGEGTSREQSLLPEGSIPLKKRIGRPRGTYGAYKKKASTSTPIGSSGLQLGRVTNSHKRGLRNGVAETFMSAKPPALSESSITIKRARGRPPRQQNLSVVVPRFNKSQLQGHESDPSAESESEDLLNEPRPQYSMVAASCQDQSGTEETTSRDQSVEPISPSKKRGFATKNAPIDLNLVDDDNERSPHPTKRVKTLPETSPDPIADDSALLLRQFEARVYGPDRAVRSGTIPHRQSQSSSTLDDNATRLSQNHAHTRTSSLGSSSTDSWMGPNPNSPKPLSNQYIPSISPLRKESFPPSRPPRENPVKNPTSHLNAGITVSHLPQQQPAKPAPPKFTSPSKPFQRKVSLTPHYPPSTSFSHRKSFDGPADTPPPPSHPPISHPPRKPLSANKTSPPQPSQTSSISKLGFAGLPSARSITDYFAPKPKPNPRQLSPRSSSSEDHLARHSSTSSTSSSHKATELGSKHDPALAESPTRTAALEIDDDDDEDSDEDSDSAADTDGSSSGVLVLRHGVEDSDPRAFGAGDRAQARDLKRA